MHVERITAWLMPILDSHYGGFCLPVAWSRYLLPGLAAETRLESFAYSVLIYVAAATANKLQQYDGNQPSFVLLIAAVGWTYLNPFFQELLFAGRRKIVERTFFGSIAVMAAAAMSVSLTVALYFYTIDTLCIILALALGRCALALADEWASPSLSFPTRGGIFAAAFAVTVAQRSSLSTTAAHLLPCNELRIAFETIEAVTQVGSLEAQRNFRHAAIELLILTIHMQMSMGFVNLKYLRKAQDRMNALLSVGPISANVRQATSSEVTKSSVHEKSCVNEVTNRIVVGEEPIGFTLVVDSTRGCLRVESVHESIRAASLDVKVGDILVEFDGNRIDSTLTVTALNSHPRPVLLGFSRPSVVDGVIRTVVEDSPSTSSTHNTSNSNCHKRLSSRSYGRHAVCFVVSCALPYLGTRAILTSCQTAATSRFQARAQADFLKRLFEDEELIPGENYPHSENSTRQGGVVASIPISSTARLRAVSQSEFTVIAYSDAVASAFGRSFGLIQGKICSLPNLALFNELLLTRPTYVGIIFPLRCYSVVLTQRLILVDS